MDDNQKISLAVHMAMQAKQVESYASSANHALRKLLGYVTDEDATKEEKDAIDNTISILSLIQSRCTPFKVAKAAQEYLETC